MWFCKLLTIIIRLFLFAKFKNHVVPVSNDVCSRGCPRDPSKTFLHFLLDPLALNYRTCQNVKNLSVYVYILRRILIYLCSELTHVWQNAHAVHVDLMSTTGDPKGVHKNKIKKKREEGKLKYRLYPIKRGTPALTFCTHVQVQFWI